MPADSEAFAAMPPSPRHLQNLAADRREAIVGVAAAEFVEHGYERASMNRIISAADVSKGSMYHYFESKADLFAVAVSAVIERLETAIGGPPVGCENVDELRRRFRTWYRSLLAHLADNPADDSLLEALRGAVTAPDPPAPLRRCLAQLGSWYAALFEELATLGALRDDLPPAVLAGVTERSTTAVDRWFIDEIRVHRARLDEFAEIGTDLFLRLVTPTVGS